MKKKNVTLKASEVKKLLGEETNYIKTCIALKSGYTTQEIAKTLGEPIADVEALKERLLKERMIEKPTEDALKLALQDARNDDDFAMLLAQAQEYNKRDLLPKQVLLLHQAMSYGMDVDVLLYIMVSIQQKKKYSEEYFIKVAQTWRDKNILHLSDIGQNEDEWSRTADVVRQGFGLMRAVTPSEMQYIKRWERYGFSYDLLRKACEKTVLLTGKISFPYCDKILADWSSKNVTTLEDVKRVDSTHAVMKRQDAARKRTLAENQRKKEMQSQTYIQDNSQNYNIEVQNMIVVQQANLEKKLDEQ